MIVFKFLISFFISFSILCIPIDRQPLFEHLYRIVSPIISHVFQGLDRKLGVHLDKAKKATHFLYSDSKPIPTSNPNSSKIMTRQTLPSDGVYEESYTNEEKETLRRILEEQQDRGH